MYVKVDYPGWHMDGEVVEGRRQFLYTKSNIALDVYLVKDPDTGEEFGIPVDKVIVLRDAPVINLKGKLHGKNASKFNQDVGMLAEVE